MIPQHRRFGILHTYASKFVYRDYPLLKLLESFYCFRVLNSPGLSTIPDFSNLWVDYIESYEPEVTFACILHIQSYWYRTFVRRSRRESSCMSTHVSEFHAIESRDSNIVDI